MCSLHGNHRLDLHYPLRYGRSGRRAGAVDSRHHLDPVGVRDSRARATRIPVLGRVGLDRTYISLLERGLRQPTLGTIVKLSTALEIQPEDFVAELGRPYKVD